MSRLTDLMRGKKPPIEQVREEQKGTYQTLFLRLLAQIPASGINPAVYSQMKLITAAVNNMSEDTAKGLAGHIKELAKAIEHYESEHQTDSTETE